MPPARTTSGSRPVFPAVDPTRRRIMQANTRRDTKPELALRSLLHRAGARFRVDFPIRPGGGRPVRPDVVFPRRRVAVYVDGCFWHNCPIHGTRPATNREYWDAKLDANRERDARTTRALEADGWTVLRFWEHEEPADAAEVVLTAIERPRP